jgi:hypothetical protein
MLTTCRQSACKIGGSAAPVKLKIALFFGIAAIAAALLQRRKRSGFFNKL